MAQSIEGALKNYTPKQFEKVFRDAFRGNDGKLIHPTEARKNLEQLYAEGVRLLPMGDCEGFDPVKGCPGHPHPDAPDCFDCPGCARCRADEIPRF